MKNLYVNITTALILLLTTSLGAQPHSQSSIGELELTDASNQRQLALLLDTDISGTINGMLASITVRQSFNNQTNDWVNGRYVFPLPEDAAVDSLRIQIGERVIDGIIKQKEEAKKTFEQAKRAGKQAGLLEQHRPNLFSISVANIAPHDEIVTSITFINKVHFENDKFSLTLPTTLTPRYIPGAPIKLTKETQNSIAQQLAEQADVEINSSSGWSVNTDDVPDASAITPPQIHPFTNQTSHYFSLSLSLNAGIELQNVSSDSHAISNVISDTQTKITLANNKEPMDSDLVLSWQARAGSLPKAAHFEQEFEGSFYSMLMVNPPKVDAMLSLPRDITFIIDSSGSMAGTSIQQAKLALNKGLDYLSSSDVFNIIDFDSRFTPLFKQSQTVNAHNLGQARNMINDLNADGGTEMLDAIRFALRANHNESYLRQIVFITDGAVGNETQLFELINSELGNTRLFTVGIGSAPNSYFMNRAAKFGRGSYTYINDLSQVNQQMDLLFKKITHPVLRDIKIDWSQKVEQYPQRIPDLYAGEPLTVLVRSDKALANINITGEMLQTPWNQKLKLNNSGSNNTDNIDAIWAREKVSDLMDKFITNQITEEQAKPLIVDLGIEHNIVTQFTSFVAVDNTPAKPVDSLTKHKSVPNLMSKGNTMAIPQTATPATLFSLLGLLMILLSTLIKRFQTGNNFHGVRVDETN